MRHQPADENDEDTEITIESSSNSESDSETEINNVYIYFIRLWTLSYLNYCLNTTSNFSDASSWTSISFSAILLVRVMIVK
jgi:hypothetical protein